MFTILSAFSYIKANKKLFLIGTAVLIITALAVGIFLKINSLQNTIIQKEAVIVSQEAKIKELFQANDNQFKTITSLRIDILKANDLVNSQNNISAGTIASLKKLLKECNSKPTTVIFTGDNFKPHKGDKNDFILETISNIGNR